MFWLIVAMLVFSAICFAIASIPGEILGGIILFVLCVMGITSGVWFFVIPSVLLLIGQMVLIFGE